MRRVSRWLCVLVALLPVWAIAAGAPPQAILSEGFESLDGGGVFRGWQVVSGHVGVIRSVRTDDGKVAAIVSVPPGTGALILRRPLAALPHTGDFTLELRARWIGGNGKLSAFLGNSIHAKQADGVKLEFHRDPTWHRLGWWTCYQDGEEPHYQTLGDLTDWSSAVSQGCIRHPGAPPEFLYLRLDPLDDHEVSFALDRLELRHAPAWPVQMVLQSTIWTDASLPLAILPAAEAMDGSAVDVSLELRDSSGGLVWQSARTITDAPLLEAIQRPAVAETDYRLDASAVRDGVRWTRHWILWSAVDLHGPPQGRQHSRELDPPTQSRLQLWSDRAPAAAYEPSALIPAEWRLADEVPASFMPSAPIIFYPSAGQPIGRYRSPLPFEHRPHPVVSFPGTQAFALIGLQTPIDLRGVSATLMLDSIPSAWHGRVQLRRMLDMPKPIDPVGKRYTWADGPFVHDDATVDLAAGTSSFWLLVLDLPPGAPAGRFEARVELRGAELSSPVTAGIPVEVYPIRLDAARSKFAIYFGPFFDETTRLAHYRDMRAIGADTAILYNVSPAQIAYRGGQLQVSLEQYAREIALCREAGLAGDDVPWIADMRFLEAQITRLSERLEADPAADEIVLDGRDPHVAPNGSAREQQLFLELMQHLRAACTSPSWPRVVWCLPQDEFEWGVRKQQVKRFAPLIRQAGFSTVVTSDAVRWGFDGAQVLDEMIDQRMYLHLTPEMDQYTRAAGDGLHFYGLAGTPLQWAYFAWRYKPGIIAGWAYLWPVGGGFYSPIDQGSWSAGEHMAWPGARGPLPGLLALRTTQAIVDARLLATADRQLQVDPESRQAKRLQAAWAAIWRHVPLDGWAFRQAMATGSLPQGNADAWRRVLAEHIVPEERP